MVRWFDGSMVRWFDGSMVRWFDGSMVRWFDGSMVRWFDGSKFSAPATSLSTIILPLPLLVSKKLVPAITPIFSSSSPLETSSLLLHLSSALPRP
ncbi:hypothetical protein CTM77_06670 [Photobacterium phosphoreum]|nr:hypothetical protein CTM77_06670 [Photobacterium phosphoreum]